MRCRFGSILGGFGGGFWRGFGPDLAIFEVFKRRQKFVRNGSDAEYPRTLAEPSQDFLKSGLTHPPGRELFNENDNVVSHAFATPRRSGRRIHDRWRVGPPPCVHCSFVVGIKVPDVRCQVAGVRCQVPGVRCQALGVGCQVPGVKGKVPGARCQV